MVYREYMADEDYVHLLVDFMGMKDGGLDVQLHRPVPSDLEQPDLSAHEARLYEAVLRDITNLVPQYCPPMTTFVVIAHNRTFNVHRPRDLEEVRSLPEALGRSVDTIKVVDCVVGIDEMRTSGDIHPFEVYFPR
jgi:hypothetical protein